MLILSLGRLVSVQTLGLVQIALGWIIFEFLFSFLLSIEDSVNFALEFDFSLLELINLIEVVHRRVLRLQIVHPLFINDGLDLAT